MKKSIKTLIAVILAMIIATGSMSAFAANDTVKYAYDSESEITEFTFADILNEGKNNVRLPDEENFYFTFDAKESGYYVFRYSWVDLGSLRVPEKKENNVYYGYTEADIFMTEEDYETLCEKYLVYLEKGSNVLLVINYGPEINETEINVEYAGKKLAGFDFAGGVDYNLIFGYGIDEWDRNDNTIEYYFDPGESTLTFDTGKKFDTFIYSICFKSETELVEGEYDITVEYLGETFEKRIKIYDITHDVKSIKVNNYEDYDTVTEYYDGCIDYDLSDLELVLEFADGRTETIVPNTGMMGIDLENGNPHYIYLGCGYEVKDDGSVDFVVEFGGHEYVRLPAEKAEAPALDNTKHLAEENMNVIMDEFYMLEWNFDDVVLGFGSDWFLDTLIFFLRDLFTLVPDIIGGMYANLSMFIR